MMLHPCGYMILLPPPLLLIHSMAPIFFPLLNTLDAPFMFSQTRPFLPFASFHQVAVLSFVLFHALMAHMIDRL